MLVAGKEEAYCQCIFLSHFLRTMLQVETMCNADGIYPVNRFVVFNE